MSNDYSNIPIILGIFVLIALVGGVAFSGSVLATTDETEQEYRTVEVIEGETFYYGQFLGYTDDTIEEGETWELVHDNGDTLTAETVDGGVLFDTNEVTNFEDVDTDNAEIRNVSGNTEVTFELARQNLEFNSNTEEVSSQFSTAEFEVVTDRTSEYDLIIRENTDSLTPQEIADLSPNFEVKTLDSGAGEEQALAQNLSGNEEFTLDFQDINEGEYFISAESRDGPVDSDVERTLDTQRIEVVDQLDGSVSGTVFTENEDYTSQITVEIENVDTNETETASGSGDSQFNYDFQNLEPGTYEILLNAENHVSQTTTVEVDENENTEVEDITLDQETATIEGTINTEETEEYDFDVQATAALTGEDGLVAQDISENQGPNAYQYSLEVPVGQEYEVNGIAEFHVRNTETVNVTEADTTIQQDFTLDLERATLEGNVETEPPEAGNITVEYEHLPSGITDSQSEQDVDSLQYSFPDIRTGAYEVTYSTDAELYTSETREITLADGVTEPNDTVTLQSQNSRVFGTISTEDTEYNGDVIIEIFDSDGELVNNAIGQSDVSYDFDTLTEGEYTVVANAEDHEELEETISLDADEEREFNATLDEIQTTSLEGTVSTENSDYQGEITVSLLDSTTGSEQFSDSSTGSDTFEYRFEGDNLSGTYDIVASASGHETITIEEDFTISSGATEVLEPTTLPESDLGTGTFSGEYSVQDNEYEGVITVEIVDNNTGNQTTLESEAGETDFTFDQELDVSEYTVTVSAEFHEEYQTIIQIEENSIIADSATLDRSATGNLDAVVETADPEFTGVTTINISGVTVDYDEGPIEAEDSPASVARELPVGTYELTADASGHEQGSTTFEIIENETTESTLTLEELSQGISGTASTQNEEYTGPITITATNVDTGETSEIVGSGPSYEYGFNLAEGTYDVEFSAEGHESVTETGVTVESDQITSEVDRTTPEFTVDLEVSVDVLTVDDNSYGDVSIDIEGPSNETISVQDGGTETVTLDGTGTYELFANEGDLTEDRQSVNADTENETYAVSLAPEQLETGTLQVTVEGTEEPVDDVDVIVESLDSDLQETRTITGSSGTVSVEVPDGNYSVSAQAQGHDTEQAEVIVELGELTTVTLPELELSSEEFVSEQTVYVGQLVDFDSIADVGDDLEFVDQESGEVYGIVLEDNTRVQSQEIADEIGVGTSEVFVNNEETPSGILTLEEQTLDSSFSQDIELPSRTSAFYEFNTNRSAPQELIIRSITTPDGSELTNEEIADKSDQVSLSNDVPVHQFTGDSGQIEFEFDEESELGEYEVTTEVSDTGVQSSAVVQVLAEQDLEDLIADEQITENGIFWEGQTLQFESDEIERGTVYRLNDGDGNLVTEIQPRQSDGSIIFETGGEITENDYVIEDPNGNALVSFLIREQTFDTEFDREDVFNDGTQTTVEVSFTSNRSSYDVVIDSDNFFDEAELAANISGASVETVTIDGEQEERAVIRNASGTEDINFQGLSSGTYDFEFTVRDTGVSSQSSVNVAELGDLTPEFTNQFYQSYEGDNAEFRVVMPEGADSAEVKIGRSDRVGYEAVIELEDSQPQDRSTAVIQMDTLIAGQGEDPEDVFTISTLVREDEEGLVTGNVVSESQISISGILNPSGYLLTLSSDGTEQDLSTLNHDPVEIDSSQAYLMPQTTDLRTIEQRLAERSDSVEEGAEDLTDIQEAVAGLPEVEENAPFFESVLITEGDTVAEPDSIFLFYDVNGFEASLNEEGRTAGDFDMESVFAQEEGFELEIVTQESEMNREKKVISPSDIQYVYDDNNKLLFFQFSPSLLNDVEAEESYDATLRITENNVVIEDEDEELEETIEFNVVEQEFVFNDPVEVEPETSQTISAETTIAPQTEVTMVARSDDVTYPFLYKEETTVDSNGVISEDFDFVGAPQGHEFTLEIEGLSQRFDAEVVEERTTLDVDIGDEEEQADEDVETVAVNVEISDSLGNEIDGTVTVDGQTEIIDGGSGEIDVAVGEEHEFVANSSGFQSQTVIQEITEEGQTVTFSLEEAEDEDEEERFRVDIEVIDEEGDNVIGAEVSTNEEVATVGENGTATLQLENGEYTLEATADEFETATTDITVEDDDLQIVMELTEETEDDTDEQTTGGETGQEGDDSTRTEGQPGFTPVTIAIALIAFGMYLKRSD